MRTAIALIAITAGMAPAQPSISAVVNAASNRLQQSALSGIAQGAMAVAYGRALGPSQAVSAGSFPLTVSLGGTSVQISAGGTTVDAFMLYSSASQIAFIVPSRTPVAKGEVRVTFNHATSAATPLDVVASNAGVFSWEQNGRGQAVANDGVSNRVITLESPARPRQVINVWGTGLGAISGDDSIAPPPGNVADLEAWVAGQKAEVLYSGRSPCCAALDQIAIRIPDAVPASCSAPLYFKGAGFVSNVLTLPVSSDGSPCPDPLGFEGLAVHNRSSVLAGMLILERGFMRSANGDTSPADFAHFGFVRYSQPYYNDYQGSEPPAGTCLTYSFGATDPSHPAVADAGALITLTLAGHSFPFPKDDFGGYGAFIQGLSPLDSSGQGILNNGAGADVPAFNMRLETPPLPPFQWKEQGNLAEVTLGQPLTLRWSGSEADGFVTISINDPNALTLACRVRGAQSQFTVPADFTRLLSPGAGTIAVYEQRPNPVSGKPGALDAFRYERRVLRSRSVTLR